MEWPNVFVMEQTREFLPLWNRYRISNSTVFLISRTWYWTLKLNMTPNGCLQFNVKCSKHPWTFHCDGFCSVLFVYMSKMENFQIWNADLLGSYHAEKEPLNPLDIYAIFIMQLGVCIYVWRVHVFQLMYAWSCVCDYPCIVPLCVLLRFRCVKQPCWCLIQSHSALVGWRPETARENKRKQTEGRRVWGLCIYNLVFG